VRVALDVTPLVGHRTGIGLAVAEIVTALGRVDTPPEIVPYALSIRARRHRMDLPAGTRFLPIPARLLLRAWGRTDHPRVDHWLGDCDAIHATNYLAPPSKRPTVVSVYDCSFLHYPELCSADVLRFPSAIRRAARRGAWIHTGSSFVAEEIREAFGRELRDPSRVVVVPLGVPGSRRDPEPTAAATESPAAPVESPFVLALGTLEPRKNLDRLVRAFGSVAGERDDIHLVLAGADGPARGAIDEAIAGLPAPVRSRVHLLGAVDDATRATLLERAALVAYPSLYEGFGFPVLEAMRAGVPVVAARAGSIPEVAGDAAELVDPLDTGSIATGLAIVLDRADRREQLVAAGRHRVEGFSWDATAGGLVALYERAAT